MGSRTKATEGTNSPSEHGDSSRPCKKCGVWKSPEGFYGRYKNVCKPCIILRVSAWQSHPNNRDKVSAIRRKYKLKSDYGITPEEYDVMSKKQGGCCGICKLPGTKGRRLAVDHCHEKGVVRGLLCTNCNTAIGSLKEAPKNFASALRYLHSHGAALETADLADLLHLSTD